MLKLDSNNKNILYVVYCKKTHNVILETEDEQKAKEAVFNDTGLSYSTYPPFTYAPNKEQGDLYETTFLEY